MNQKKYNLEVSKENGVYAFTSKGSQGDIVKVVQFSPIDDITTLRVSNVHNLGFGDYDPITDAIDDKVTSNNGDRDVILATVGTAAIDFLKENLDYTLYALGSTPIRTRLYQMGISKFHDEIVRDHNVWGLRKDGVWEVFERNTNYQAFVMRKR